MVSLLPSLPPNQCILHQHHCMYETQTSPISALRIAGMSTAVAHVAVRFGRVGWYLAVFCTGLDGPRATGLRLSKRLFQVQLRTRELDRLHVGTASAP